MIKESHPSKRRRPLLLMSSKKPLPKKLQLKLRLNQLLQKAKKQRRSQLLLKKRKQHQRRRQRRMLLKQLPKISLRKLREKKKNLNCLKLKQRRSQKLREMKLSHQVRGRRWKRLPERQMRKLSTNFTPTVTWPRPCLIL